MDSNLQSKIDNIDLSVSVAETNEFQDKLALSLVENKSIIGLMGYAGCGKDTVADILVERYGFKKFKFANILKEFLNENFKELVFNDLISKGEFIEYNQINFLEEDDRIIKEKLRPYMIYISEKIKEVYGKNYWVNKALHQIENEGSRIVIADVRRENELEIFKNGKNSIKTKWNSYSKSGILTKEDVNEFLEKERNIKKTNSLLVYINQFKLSGEDVLTKNTILSAMENWLIDDEIKVDSRIPNEGSYRQKYIESTVDEFVLRNNI